MRGRPLRLLARALLALAAASPAPPAGAQGLSESEISARIDPPYALGEKIDERGVWTLVDLAGVPSGYIFETRPLAPIPGFSGQPIDVLVAISNDGRFIDADLIEHNEPIFVSGLGEAPFHEFIAQYRGLSLSDTITVGAPYGAQGDAAGHVYLDGVTKATASVRIAHESILAAALAVARERMQGVAAGPPAYPDPDHEEALDWADLVEQGLASRRLVTNAEAQAAFAGTVFEDDDPEALDDPEGVFLDLWVVDIGPPAIARAALDADTLEALAEFQSVATHDEPILVVDAGRHGLVSDEFVRNTAPDLLSASQDGLPVALRDADLFVGLAEGAPEATAAMILRTDRRLGFDPTRPWTLEVTAVREHGSFMPQVGTASFTVEHVTPERFFERPEVAKPRAPWVEAILARRADLGALGALLALGGFVMARRMSWLAGRRFYVPIRLAVLALVIGFVGFWAQGQLSIVTPLGVIRTVVEGGSFAFLLYDPFSLLLWIAVIGSFFLWGRGFFCGWLCPYGAMQEVSHRLGRLARLPRLRLSARWDARLKWVKYGVLALLVGAALTSATLTDALVEVEPFKTAVTTYFVRDWPYVLYAAGWLVLGLFLFKGFCRYVCPLGAALALGGLLRRKDWIARRPACGSPCQLCRVKCDYQAIEPSGRIRYDECFQCLDCVTIHDSPARCVPLVIEAKKGRRPAPPRLAPVREAEPA